MKTLVTIIALIGIVGGAIAVQGHDMSKMKGTKMPAKASVSLGVQKATIVVDNGFKPSVINVKAGRPVQITFDTKHKACITSVNFEGMKMKSDLTDGKKTVVTFTPKKAGTYAFACPMKMFSGKVVAK